MNQPIKLRWGRRLLWLLIGMLGLMWLLLFLWWRSAPAALPSNPFEPPEMAAAHYASRDVVGDLGGMPVTIPRHFADLVEYNGDPGWGEKRKGHRPERTHASKLSSFGFYVRLPDMAGLSSEELRLHKKNQKMRDTMWISVGLNLGERYPGDGFLDRLTNAMGKPGNILKYEQYEQLPDRLYGLTVYAAGGVDPKSNKPYREDTDAHDIFVHRDDAGKVDTYIRCSNRNVPAPPCTQYISLEPNLKADIYISYRRGLLPEWQQIQTSVTQLILSFRAPTPTPTPAARAIL
jgi:hypothetical protein